MTDLLFALIRTNGDVVVLVTLVLGLFIGLLLRWEFYEKPCRDALRSIDATLKAAPWMRSQAQTGVKRVA